MAMLFRIYWKPYFLVLPIAGQSGQYKIVWMNFGYVIDVHRSYEALAVVVVVAVGAESTQVLDRESASLCQHTTAPTTPSRRLRSRGTLAAVVSMGRDILIDF